MKRLLIALLAVVMLAGCAAPAAVVGPSAATLSQGLKLHDIFEDTTKFTYAYEKLGESSYDYYNMTCTGATVEDFNTAMEKAKDAGFVENSSYDGMTEVFSYVGYKEGYQCYMCLVYGCFEMTIRPENHLELQQAQEANDNE